MKSLDLFEIDVIFVIFFSPEGEEDFFELIKDKELVSRVGPVIDARSGVESFKNRITSIGDQIKSVSLTAVTLQGSLPGKYDCNPFLRMY